MPGEVVAKREAADRPRIVGIANIAVKVDNLEEARKFYSGVVGMAETGRILHHLKNNIQNPRNMILIVSWQAPNTLGRRLADLAGGHLHVLLADRPEHVLVRIGACDHTGASSKGSLLHGSELGLFEEAYVLQGYRGLRSEDLNSLNVVRGIGIGVMALDGEHANRPFS